MDPQYFAKTPFYKSMNAKILSIIPSQDRQILEWGCAFGDLTVNIARKLPKARIYGVESDTTIVEMICGKYAPEDYRNVHFEVAHLDEIEDYVKVRYLQLDLLVLPFILHRLGDREKKFNFFKDIVKLPASPRIIVCDLFQPANATERAIRKFWDERAGEIYRHTFWREFDAELEREFNFGEAKRIAQQAAREAQSLELEMGKNLTSKEDSYLISESDLEQIAAEAGFSHIFHEKVDAWGNSIFVIQK